MNEIECKVLDFNGGDFGMLRARYIVLTLTLALATPLLAASDKADAEKGKELFETKCSVCHNADSKEKKIGPGLQGIKDGKLPSDKDATHKNILENLNKGGGGMPAFLSRLLGDSLAGLWDLAATSSEARRASGGSEKVSASNLSHHSEPPVCGLIPV